MRVFIVVRTPSDDHAKNLVKRIHKILGRSSAMIGKKSNNEILVRTDHSQMRRLQAEITKYNATTLETE